MLVRPYLAGEQLAHAADPGHRAGRGQGLRGRPQLVGVRPDRLVLGAEPPGEAGVGGRQPDLGRRGDEGTQRVQYHRDIDGLLQQRAPHRGQQPGGRGAHGGQRQAHPGQHALQGDPPGTPGQYRHLAKAADLVDGENRVRRFRRRGGAPGSHGDPHVGQGQRGGVVDPVARHDHGCQALLTAHHVQLVLRGEPGDHLVDAGERADGVGCFRAVAGRQHDPADSALAQRPDRLPGIGADPVLKQQHARRPGRRWRRTPSARRPAGPGGARPGPTARLPRRPPTRRAPAGPLGRRPCP